MRNHPDATRPDPDADAADEAASEDRRRPKAMLPYAVLWLTTAMCVIFAVFELANQA